MSAGAAPEGMSGNGEESGSENESADANAGASAETRRALLVDAFAAEPLAGNAAGVVPDAAGLGEAQMAAVARELNASETVFVLPPEAEPNEVETKAEAGEKRETADRRFRYFTPTGEIDLCGHATVAGHFHLYADGVLGAGEHTVQTAAGVLDVRVTEDGTVWTTYPEPAVRRVEGREGASADGESGDGSDLRGRVAAALDVPADRMLEDLPLAVADAGVPFLLVPLDYLTTLRGADPEMSAVSEVCGAVGAAGVYAFTFDTLAADADVHGRAFAPTAGVPEDPVTGTASGAVAAYLRSSGAFEEVPEELVCEQGHVLDRPGRVRVRLDPLRVGGTAATALDGEVRVPDPGEEEIIEA